VTTTFYQPEGTLQMLFGRANRIAMNARIAFADFRHSGAIRRSEQAVLGLTSLGPPVTRGPILVDGCFWHPNYWLRYGLLRAAWGLGELPAAGVVGRYARSSVRSTMRRFGVSRLWALGNRVKQTAAARAAAEKYLSKMRCAEDILEWKLPKKIPAFDIYDGLLKIQRKAKVDPHHPDVLPYVADWFAHLDEFERILDETKPSLAILSHTQSARDFYGVFAGCLLERGIEIVVPMSYVGTLQNYRVRTQSELFRFNDGLRADELVRLPPDKQLKLRELGRGALEARLGGISKEFSGVLAFGRDTSGLTREAICRQFGWNTEAPLVVILSSTWFDFPHLYGTTRFRDFEDWIRSTADAAAKANGINFLVRGHPADPWYKNVFVSDLLGESRANNIGICPYGLNGAAIMRAVDAAITYYGTAGIEYPAFGKPVMVADRGWYHEHSFAYLPSSRENYLTDVGRQWWVGRDMNSAAYAAQIYAGVRFGRPAWQKDMVYHDDALMTLPEIAARNPALLATSHDTLQRELDTLRRWYFSDHQLYHSFKMLEANDYVI
jgi:hypothetical protein